MKSKLIDYIPFLSIVLIFCYFLSKYFNNAIPIIMGDEASYIINTNSLLKVVFGLSKQARYFTSHPLGYPFFSALTIRILSVFPSVGISTHQFLIITNLIVYILIALATQYLLKYKSSASYSKSVFYSALLLLYPPLVCYTFFSMSDVFLTLIFLISSIITYLYLEKNYLYKNIPINNILVYSVFLLLISLIAVSVKEFGVLLVINFFLINFFLFIRSNNNKNKLLYLLILFLFLILWVISFIFYQSFLIKNFDVALFDRNDTINISTAFGLFTNRELFIRFTSTFIKISFAQIALVLLTTFGFFQLSLKILFKTILLNKSKIETVFHNISTVILASSMLYTSAYFSFVNAVSGIRFDNLFYERYNLPAFYCYLVSLVMILQRNKNEIFKTQFKSKYIYFYLLIILILVFSFINHSNLVVRVFNIPTLSFLYISSLFQIVILLFVFILVFYLLKIKNEIKTFINSNKVLFLIATIQILIIVNFLINFYGLEQNEKSDRNQIATYIIKHFNSDAIICYDPFQAVMYDFWTSKYLLLNNSIIITRFIEDGNIACDAIISSSIFASKNDDFVLVQQENDVDVKLYVNRFSKYFITNHTMTNDYSHYSGTIEVLSLNQKSINIKISNTSQYPWKSRFGELQTHGSIRIAIASNTHDLYGDKAIRCDLPFTLYPNETAEVDCKIPKSIANSKSLVLDLLHEGYTWFHIVNSTTPIKFTQN